MRCDATRRALLIPSRARFTFQATKIHYNLSRSRLVSYNIRGVLASKNAHSHPICFSLFLSSSHIPLWCFARWTRNIISVYKNGILKRVSIGSVWSFRKLRTMNSRTGTLHRVRSRFWYVVPSSNGRTHQKRRIIATYYFERGLSGDRQDQSKGEISGGGIGGNHGGRNRREMNERQTGKREGEKWSGRALYEMRYTHVDKMRPHLHVPRYGAMELRTAPQTNGVSKVRIRWRV